MLTKSLCTEKEVVTIGDREADIFEFFTEAQNLNTKVLIRAARNRRLLRDEVDLKNQTLSKSAAGNFASCKDKCCFGFIPSNVAKNLKILISPLPVGQ